jgi:hypothetical protein
MEAESSLSCCCARCIQSTSSHPISLRSIPILSSHLRLGPSSGLFPSGFPTKILYALPNIKSTFRYMCRSKNPSKSEALWSISWQSCLLQWGNVSLCPIRKLENHPLSASRYCLLNIFTAALHIRRPSPPSATWGRAMPWWQEPTRKLNKLKF